jgi:hypothetical protein
MNTQTTLVLAVLGMPLLYTGARIVFRAYFTAKLEYQQLLFHRLKEEE